MKMSRSPPSEVPIAGKRDLVEFQEMNEKHITVLKFKSPFLFIRRQWVRFRRPDTSTRILVLVKKIRK